MKMEAWYVYTSYIYIYLITLVKTKTTDQGVYLYAIYLSIIPVP